MDKSPNQISETLVTHPGPVTLKDIALHAKVSEVAAGRVLLGSGKNSVRVGVATAERIRQIAQQLGYQPNRVAQQLAGKRSKVVGVIIDSYAPQIDFIKMSEMERESAKRGYRFMVGQSHGELDRIEAYAVDFLHRGVEGIICISHQYPEGGVKISNILNRLKNVVYIYKPSIVDENTCYVDVDIADGVAQACEHLLQKGRKRIALLMPHFETSTLKSRYEGFMRVLSKYSDVRSLIWQLKPFGLENHLDELNEPDQEIVEIVAKKIIEQDHPDAILVFNDIGACRIIKYVHKMGLNIPQDIAVVGFDNLQASTVCEPELTTIDQQPKKLARMAINMLIDLIEGNELSREERQVVIAPKLVIRNST